MQLSQRFNSIVMELNKLHINIYFQPEGTEIGEGGGNPTKGLLYSFLSGSSGRGSLPHEDLLKFTLLHHPSNHAEVPHS